MIGLKDSNGLPMYETPQKTGFLGYMSALISLGNVSSHNFLTTHRYTMYDIIIVSTEAEF